MAFSPDGYPRFGKRRQHRETLGSARPRASTDPQWAYRVSHSVTFSPDGQTLASTSEDGTVKLWGVQTGMPVRTFSGHASGWPRLLLAPPVLSWPPPVLTKR